MLDWIRSDSRRTALFAIGGGALIVAIVVLVFVVFSGGDDDTAGTSVPTGETAGTGVESTTTTLIGFSPSGEVTFTVSASMSGSTLVVGVGDEVLASLPIEADGIDSWEIVEPPDHDILRLGGSFTFFPSEPGQGRATHDFSFTAVGPGETSLTLTLGDGPTVTINVQVTEA